MAGEHNSRTAPQGAFVVWSYKKRSATSLSDPNGLPAGSASTVNRLWTITKSLKSMSTSKTKSSPAGTFEIRLAPTGNWVARLTPGSWCVLLMTKDQELDLNDFQSQTADPTSLKFFGRITDVRVSIGVDSETGARQTEYVVSGKDWGSVFESKLYIDPFAIGEYQSITGEILNNPAAAKKLFFNDMLIDLIDKNNGLPTSTINCQALLRTWGAPVKDIEEDVNNKLLGLKKKQFTITSGTFDFPLIVLKYLKLIGPSKTIADYITWFTGRLIDTDNNAGQEDISEIVEASTGDGLSSTNKAYKEVEESGGFPDPNSIWGEHQIWQLLLDNSCPIINELLTDLRFDGNKPTLAIYKRIKPFCMTKEFEGSELVDDKISLYKNVRTTKIPLGDVVSIHAGTNWEGKINFIEVQPKPSLIKNANDASFKAESQIFDTESFHRDGFRPKIMKSQYLPFVAGTKEIDLSNFSSWNVLLAQWHFNQHMQLNGAATIIGQNVHIQVGDNVKFDASILGQSYNFNKTVLDAAENGLQDNIFFLAHVESLSHSFNVSDTGARSFTTSINFSRGVFVDDGGELWNFNEDSDEISGAIDQDSSGLDLKDTLNVDVWATSVDGDPND